MSTQVPGKQLRLNHLGTQVIRAAATLPATTTGTLFTITGGNVLITSIIGKVTTVMSGTATNLKLNAANTATGSNTDLCSNVAVTSKAVGTLFSIPTAGSAGTVGDFVVVSARMILQTGSIRAITDATNTGAMEWYVNYIPINDGAYVTAA